MCPVTVETHPPRPIKTVGGAGLRPTRDGRRSARLDRRDSLVLKLSRAPRPGVATAAVFAATAPCALAFAALPGVAPACTQPATTHPFALFGDKSGYRRELLAK